MSDQLIHFNSEKVPEIPSLSHAVQVGSLGLVAGQVGIPLGKTTAPTDPVEEINNVLDSLEAVLEAAGASRRSVIRTTCYLSQLEYVELFNEIYNERFQQPRPARTTVQAQLIGGLRFEIDAVALMEE